MKEKNYTSPKQIRKEEGILSESFQHANLNYQRVMIGRVEYPIRRILLDVPLLADLTVTSEEIQSH